MLRTLVEERVVIPVHAPWWYHRLPLVIPTSMIKRVNGTITEKTHLRFQLSNYS